MFKSEAVREILTTYLNNTDMWYNAATASKPPRVVTEDFVDEITDLMICRGIIDE